MVRRGERRRLGNASLLNAITAKSTTRIQTASWFGAPRRARSGEATTATASLQGWN